MLCLFICLMWNFPSSVVPLRMCRNQKDNKVKDFRREIEGLDRQYHAGEMSMLDYANKRDDSLDEYHSLLMGRVKCVTDIFDSVDAAMIAADEYASILSSSFNASASS